MDVVYFDLSDIEERYIFICAVWQVIEWHHSHRRYDMCFPYHDILRAVFDNPSSVCLFGGVLECAEYALEHSRKFPAVCSCLLRRMRDTVVQE